MSDVLSPDKLAAIRQLNDLLRVRFVGGRILLTATVAALDADTKALVLTAVRGFTSFDESNDPHGEHDLCIVEVKGERYIAKVDYFAPDMQHGSEDPADPEKTRRVLTVMHVTDY